ncbi:MAG: hypothetical protein A2X94_05555 [Bdellovibrionales bacterium GWB1_55_8]|nr:MAG: hypothetical protein A2X94_05555 [Bdellovibrionales bacterium GWB1_55_8]
MESKNLSIMITDLKGYSQKSASSSRTDLVALVKTHTNLLAPVIEFYRGTIVKSMGDSFLCYFDSATDATVCAIAIQVLVKEFNKQQMKEDSRLTIRAVVSSGDVALTKGDIYGEAVNLAARMEKLPELSQGGISISESTWLLVNQQEIVAEFIGEREFKGISRPIKVYSVPLEKQKLSQLPTRLLNLVERVASGDNAEITQLTSYKPQKRNSIPLILSASGIALLLAVFTVIYFTRSRPSGPTREQLRILHIIGRSDVGGRGGYISQKDFAGPQDVFQMLDKDRDRVITPEEIMNWAESENLSLQPPQQSGGFPPGGPPPPRR